MCDLSTQKPWTETEYVVRYFDSNCCIYNFATMLFIP